MMESLSCKKIMSENLKVIRENVFNASAKCGRKPEEISIMAVTKTMPYDVINEAFREGVTLFGENRVQEFKGKLPFYEIPKDKIHFIGHLQTNKIRDIIDSVSMIESVGSIHLAEELSKESKKRGILTSVLLQVNIGAEETKGGFFKSEIADSLKQIRELENIKVCGLMAIPPRISGDKYFKEMQELFLLCKELEKENSDSFSVLSMGMSEDYCEAIACGSTQIRLGRALFGERR